MFGDSCLVGQGLPTWTSQNNGATTLLLLSLAPVLIGTPLLLVTSITLDANA